MPHTFQDIYPRVYPARGITLGCFVFQAGPMAEKTRLQWLRVHRSEVASSLVDRCHQASDPNFSFGKRSWVGLRPTSGRHRDATACTRRTQVPITPTSSQAGRSSIPAAPKAKLSKSQTVVLSPAVRGQRLDGVDLAGFQAGSSVTVVE